MYEIPYIDDMGRWSLLFVCGCILLWWIMSLVPVCVAVRQSWKMLQICLSELEIRLK